MILRIGVIGLFAMLAAGAGGCFKADVRVPDVSINAPSDSGTSPSSGARRTPYAKELEKVLDKHKDVQKNLGKRDWEEVQDDAADWASRVRKLMGKSGTSANAGRMNELCSELLKEIDGLGKAAAARDAQAATGALARTEPVLNRLSSEFPLSEAVAPPPGPGAGTPVAP